MTDDPADLGPAARQWREERDRAERARGKPQRNARPNGGGDEPHDAPPPLIICPTIFKGLTPPPKRWIAPQWIPYDVVTGLYGDGGVGKTLAAQQLQTGTALGSSWLGLPVEQVTSLGVYCEDGKNDLWRRQRDIDVTYVVDDDNALKLAHWMPRLGEDNILMTFRARVSAN